MITRWLCFPFLILMLDVVCIGGEIFVLEKKGCYCLSCCIYNFSLANQTSICYTWTSVRKGFIPGMQIWAHVGRYVTTWCWLILWFEECVSGLSPTPVKVWFTRLYYADFLNNFLLHTYQVSSVRLESQAFEPNLKLSSLEVWISSIS